MNDKNFKSSENITQELDPTYDPHISPKMRNTDYIIGCCCCSIFLLLLILLLAALFSPYGGTVILIFVIICWIIGITKALWPNTNNRICK